MQTRALSYRFVARRQNLISTTWGLPDGLYLPFIFTGGRFRILRLELNFTLVFLQQQN
jgi:hypothetical protein